MLPLGLQMANVVRRFRHPLLTLTLIGAILAVVTAGFAFAAGWIGPARLTPAAVIDALERNGGLYSGFRRAHAKGLCFTGRFDSNGRGMVLSKASVFEAGEVPVFGRFSTGGGNPVAPDGRLAFHAVALNFQLRDGEVWRTAMDDTPIFLVATPQAFVDFQLATAPDPQTGEPDAARVAAFLAGHPETRAFMAWMRDNPLPSSFANGTYYSINAFRFTDAAGRSRFVRWSLVPEAPFGTLDKATLASLGRDFLFEDIAMRLRQGPLHWHMIVTVAAPGDPTNDATKQWPADREAVNVGTLVIDRAQLEGDGACRDVTFDPLILPDGIAASDDPLLPARSAAYAVSLTRRAGEPAQPGGLAENPAIREAVQ